MFLHRREDSLIIFEGARNPTIEIVAKFLVVGVQAATTFVSATTSSTTGRRTKIKRQQ
jgi:hypothetical protein